MWTDDVTMDYVYTPQICNPDTIGQCHRPVCAPPQGQLAPRYTLHRYVCVVSLVASPCQTRRQTDRQTKRHTNRRLHLCQQYLCGQSTRSSGRRRASAGWCRQAAGGSGIAADDTVRATRTIRYDTRCSLNVRSKADTRQLNLPHGTES